MNDAFYSATTYYRPSRHGRVLLLAAATAAGAAEIVVASSGTAEERKLLATCSARATVAVVEWKLFKR